MQNSSQFLVPGGEFAWDHLPVHVVQESKSGMVIRTAESNQPRVKDPHEQDHGSRTRDLHGAIGGATMQLHHKKRCSHVFTDSQTHVPSQGTEFVMNFVLRYGGNRTHAGANPDLIRSVTLTTRSTEYI